MTLDDFKYRYFIISKTEIKNQKTKSIKLLGEEIYHKYNNLMKGADYHLHESYAILVDVIDKKVIMLCDTSGKSFILDMKHHDFKDFKPFKSGKKLAYNQNVIQMNYIEGRIEEVYAVDGVWCLIHYITGSGKNRVLVNKNTFGRFALLNSRDYKIHKLLNE